MTPEHVVGGELSSKSTLGSRSPSRVFLSYNRKDQETVRRLRAGIESRGISVFMDSTGLSVGLSWMAELEAAIETARAVLVVFGKHGLGNMQKREMWLALERQAAEEGNGRTYQVIPVLIDGATAKDLPGFLRQNNTLDLSTTNIDAIDVSQLLIAERGPDNEGTFEICPYRGLRRFREEDAPYFFGREALTDRLEAAIEEHPLVAVIGASGTGKSSLVQAGLLPRLRRRRPPAFPWEIVSFVPDRDPFFALAHAAVSQVFSRANETSVEASDAREIAKSLGQEKTNVAAVVRRMRETLSRETRLLVLVDQFEELFTLVNPNERARFLDQLVACSQDTDVRIAITLRADFYAQAIGHRGLSDLVQRGLVNVPPMSPPELLAAIKGPAAASRLRLESGLAERLVEQFGTQPGALPLLEFALEELWTRKSRNELTNAALSDIISTSASANAAGRRHSKGVIAAQAERAVAALAAEEQEAGLRAFTRLVRISTANEGAGDTRRRVPLESLTPIERKATEAFIEARLLVVGREDGSGREVLDIAHEAVITQWPRLRETIDKQRAFLVWRQQIESLLELWRTSNKDSGLLLHGAVLKVARQNLKVGGAEIPQETRNYILRSATFARRPWWIGAGLTLLTVVALWLGIKILTRSPDPFYFVNQYVRAASNLAQVIDADVPRWLEGNEQSQDTVIEYTKRYNTAWAAFNDKSGFVSAALSARAKSPGLALEAEALLRELQKLHHEQVKPFLIMLRAEAPRALSTSLDARKTLIDRTHGWVNDSKPKFSKLEGDTLELQRSLVYLH